MYKINLSCSLCLLTTNRVEVDTFGVGWVVKMGFTAGGKNKKATPRYLAHSKVGRREAREASKRPPGRKMSSLVAESPSSERPSLYFIVPYVPSSTQPMHTWIVFLQATATTNHSRQEAIPGASFTSLDVTNPKIPGTNIKFNLLFSICAAEI